jgi:cytochrome c oxidase subunit 2
MTLVTANEIRIPTATKVRLNLQSADVIHSFWIPSLNGKRDLVPGRINQLTIEADRPGIYRGQCAEFCGLEHAHMVIYVIAQPPGEHQAWMKQQLQTAAAGAPAESAP